MKKFKFINIKTKILFAFLSCIIIFATSYVLGTKNKDLSCEGCCQVLAETEPSDANILSKSWASILIGEVPEIQSCRTIKSLVFDKYSSIPTGYSAKVIVSVDSDGDIFASYKKLADSSYDVVVWSESTMFFPQDSSYLFGSTSAPSNNTFFSLTNLVFKNIDTSNVQKMNAMFQNCLYLENLNLSMFDTSNVTSFDYMFFWCTHLQTLDISSFRTPKATLMDLMFYGCKELKSIDLTYFDTSLVTNMDGMFRTTYKLETLVLGENFKTSNVKSMNNMFDYCGYDFIDVSGFDTSNVRYMNGMFIGCEQSELDLSSFDTKNVIEMSEMFYCCSNLTKLNVSSFNVAKVVDMSSMFSSCASLTSLNLNNFYTTSAKYMNSMFSGCTSLTSLDISNFDTQNVQDMSSMFSSCGALEDLDLGHFSTQNVTSMKSMFYKCGKLKNINLSSFDTSNVTNMQSMFFNNGSLIELDLSNFDLCNCSSQSMMLNGTAMLKRFVAPYTSSNNQISIALSNDNDYYIVSDYGFGSVTKATNDASYSKSTLSKYNGEGDIQKTILAIHHTITWKNDTTILKTEKVGYGEVPQYVGETPLKQAENGKKYVFDGWTPKPEKVTKDQTYTAQFVAEDEFYTISFVVNNELFGTTSISCLTNIPAGTRITSNNNTLYVGDIQVVATPRESTQKYIYSFDSWSNVESSVSGDLVICANFIENIKKFTITWINYDDSVIDIYYNVPYGTIPVYNGETPTREDTKQYSFTFVGWEPDITEVTTDATFKAVYTKQEKTFKITINVNNHLYGRVNLSEVSNLSFGTVIIKNQNCLKINDITIVATSCENDAHYSYKFIGFNGFQEIVEADMVITVVFERVVNKYTITWINENGEVLETSLVEYGIVPVYAGDTPNKQSTADVIYVFNGWNKEILPVTQNETYTAVFTSFSSTYTINASIVNGQISPNGSVDVLYGESQKFTFLPNEGYVVYSIKIDSVNLNEEEMQSAIANGYVFDNVLSDHTIDVECEKIVFTVSLKIFKDNIIDTENYYQINYGENFDNEIEQLSGYYIDKIIINNKEVVALEQLNIKNIQQDTEILIYYKQNTSSTVVIIIVSVVVLVIGLCVFANIKRRKYY